MLLACPSEPPLDDPREKTGITDQGAAGPEPESWTPDYQSPWLPTFDIQGHRSLWSSNDKSKEVRSGPAQLTGFWVPERPLHKGPRVLSLEENIYLSFRTWGKRRGTGISPALGHRREGSSNI